MQQEYCKLEVIKNHALLNHLIQSQTILYKNIHVIFLENTITAKILQTFFKMVSVLLEINYN